MENKNSKLKDFLLFLLDVAVSLAIAFVLVKFVFLPCHVDGKSMYPTVEPNDFGFSSIIRKTSNDIERFDIVVIKHDGMKDRIIKRVIGLPNEKITYKDDKLYIDDVYIEEDFLDDEYVSAYDTFTNDFEYQLKDDEYFAIGDNRPVSYDSRYLGPFRRDEILSVGLFVFYPFSRFGSVK